jgi:hypothetical protein
LFPKGALHGQRRFPETPVKALRKDQMHRL